MDIYIHSSNPYVRPKLFPHLDLLFKGYAPGLKKHLIQKLPQLLEISIESTLDTLATHLRDYSHEELVDSLSQKAILQM